MGGCQGGPWGAWGTRSHSTGIIDRDLSPPHGWKGQGSAPVLVRGGRIWGVDAETLRSAPQPWGGERGGTAAAPYRRLEEGLLIAERLLGALSYPPCAGLISRHACPGDKGDLGFRQGLSGGTDALCWCWAGSMSTGRLNSLLVAGVQVRVPPNLALRRPGA